MAQHTITALFDSRADASNAVTKLVEAGIARTSIQVLPEQDTETTSAQSSPYDYDRDAKGFWASLSSLFMPEEDRAVYSEGMKEEAIYHHQPIKAVLETLLEPEFWYESFQNWQSEFLSIAVLLVLGIFLRERGSPESKPVAAPHSVTGH